MKRAEMIEQIVQKYKSNRKIIDDYSKSEKNSLETKKNGVYAFYDDSGNLLYIGMVSNAQTASLYARLYSNGNASHSKKKWFENVKSVYFYELNTTDKFDIQVLERVLIRELKPQHNDLEFDESEIKSVLSKM